MNIRMPEAWILYFSLAGLVSEKNAGRIQAQHAPTHRVYMQILPQKVKQHVAFASLHSRKIVQCLVQRSMLGRISHSFLSKNTESGWVESVFIGHLVQVQHFLHNN